MILEAFNAGVGFGSGTKISNYSAPTTLVQVRMKFGVVTEVSTFLIITCCQLTPPVSIKSSPSSSSSCSTNGLSSAEKRVNKLDSATKERDTTLNIGTLQRSKTSFEIKYFCKQHLKTLGVTKCPKWGSLKMKRHYCTLL